jgi:hypothetical protein
MRDCCIKQTNFEYPRRFPATNYGLDFNTTLDGTARTDYRILRDDYNEVRVLSLDCIRIIENNHTSCLSNISTFFAVPEMKPEVVFQEKGVPNF